MKNSLVLFSMALIRSMMASSKLSKVVRRLSPHVISIHVYRALSSALTLIVHRIPIPTLPPTLSLTGMAATVAVTPRKEVAVAPRANSPPHVSRLHHRPLKSTPTPAVTVGLVVVRTMIATMIAMMVLDHCVNSVVSFATLLLGATNGLTVIF
jgi:hypothetical protein